MQTFLPVRYSIVLCFEIFIKLTLEASSRAQARRSTFELDVDQQTDASLN